MNTVLQHWQIIAAVIAASAAFGGQQVQIGNLKEAVQAQTQIQANQSEMREQAARVDERTKAILEQQQRQEAMLQELLRRSPQ